MRFLVDAQLSPRVAEWLRNRGHGAEYVGPMATDKSIVARAKEIDAVIVSKDGDFVGLLENTEQPPAFLWVRVGNTSNRVLFERLEAKWAAIEAALAQGHKVVELD